MIKIIIGLIIGYYIGIFSTTVQVLRMENREQVFFKKRY